MSRLYTTFDLSTSSVDLSDLLKLIEKVKEKGVKEEDISIEIEKRSSYHDNWDTLVVSYSRERTHEEEKELALQIKIKEDKKKKALIENYKQALVALEKQGISVNDL